MWMYGLLALSFVAGYALGRSHSSVGKAEAALGGKPGGTEGASREDQFGHLKLILSALHELRGQALDTSHMDELLELGEVASEETKRSRRARIVSDVNAWGWTACDRPILTRQRDEEDRRRTLYVVDTFDLPEWARSV